MSIRRSNRLAPRFEEAAQEEAAPLGRGMRRARGRVPQPAPVPAPAPVDPPPVVNAEQMDDQEEIEVEPAPQPAAGNGAQGHVPPVQEQLPQAPNLADILERQTRVMERMTDMIAAFIAEPVIGAGGVIPPPKTYFEKIQAVLKRYDILFIADEVITAFGRLGTMFGCDMYNIKPDLVSLAKALSSAYMPIGAILVSPEITDVLLLMALHTRDIQFLALSP
nr:unnamed protein product [Digitaria exilis]